MITQIALANPHLAGIGFDLPEVAPIFEDYVSDNGLSGRVRFHPGSFFDAPIPADVVMMGHILHDWNVDTKTMLIRKAYEALPSVGAFVVYETIIDDDRRQDSGRCFIWALASIMPTVFGLSCDVSDRAFTPDFGWVGSILHHMIRVGDRLRVRRFGQESAAR